MATFVLTDAYVSIGAVDFSDHVKSVEVTYSKEVLDVTPMGATGKARKAGLADWKAVVTFYRDFAGGASALDLILWNAVTTAVACKFRTSKTNAISATNPEYQGNALVEDYVAISGGVGDMSEVPVTLLGSDGVALVRDETP